MPKNKKEPKPVNYCSNKLMKIEIKKFQIDGQISEALGQMFLDIATKYANKSSFYNYTEKSDWINDCVLRMCQQVDRVNLEHPRCNPFSYFTMLVHRKLITSVEKLNKRLKAKNDLMERFLDEIEHNSKIKKHTTLRRNINEHNQLDYE